MEHLEEENVTPDTTEEVEEQENSQTKDDEEEDEQIVFEKKRYNEIVAGKQKQVDKLTQIAIDSAYKSARYDANSLVELHETDPKLAEAVAKKFGFDSYKEAEKEIKKMSSDGIQKKEEDDDFDTKYAKRRAEERHEEAMKKASKTIAKLDEELQEKAQTYLEKITKGQKLDTESIEEYIDMVTLYVTKDKVDEKKIQKAKESFHSSNVSKSSKGASSDDDFYIANGKIVYPSKK